MNNQIAVGLVALLVGLLLLDAFVLHLDLPLFMARQFVELIEWVSFWR